jgi:hypothetical protein
MDPTREVDVELIVHHSAFFPNTFSSKLLEVKSHVVVDHGVVRYSNPFFGGLKLGSHLHSIVPVLNEALVFLQDSVFSVGDGITRLIEQVNASVVTAIIRSEDGLVDRDTFAVDAVHAVHHVTLSELSDLSGVFLRRLLEGNGPFSLCAHVHANGLDDSAVCAISLKHSGFPLHPGVRASRVGEASVRVSLVLLPYFVFTSPLVEVLLQVFSCSPSCAHRVLVLVVKVVADSSSEEEPIFIQVDVGARLGMDIKLYLSRNGWVIPLDHDNALIDEEV